MSDANGFSERDRKLLKQFDMTEEQVLADEAALEDEHTDLGLVGPVYYGLHLEKSEEETVTVSLRLPKTTAERLSRNAAKYHISRSEYMRRHLADA